MLEWKIGHHVILGSPVQRLFQGDGEQGEKVLREFLFVFNNGKP